MMKAIKEHGGNGALGEALGEAYLAQYQQSEYQVYNQQMMENEVRDSVEKQKQVEAGDTLDFDHFLENYFDYLK